MIVVCFMCNGTGGEFAMPSSIEWRTMSDAERAGPSPWIDCNTCKGSGRLVTEHKPYVPRNGGRSIRTDYWAKPIPDRRFDWEAYPDEWDLGMPVGLGATEQEAINDLIEKMEDEEVSEGGRTPLIRRMEDDDGRRLRGESD